MVSVDFDQAASYALERLKTPEIKLKPEKVMATGSTEERTFLCRSLPALASVSAAFYVRLS